ncbi:antibiotic biosynthesis monooxygenase [Clostridium sp. SHJSY1]|uniref:putative quinol monooxygenase n=1 Tax=Clostridium sp. SHJSY1 TaxID=2942483 RepID=UPI002874352B|nr:putative quinol monooxygenase [Clostridium sp. SHJSY1]MDS0527943.1 antibiotic biosynthesis monooxygenase [Clostridium sp. SHJSY1]
MISVYAKNVVKESKVEEFIKLAKELIEETRKENGNISYELIRVVNTSNELVFLEKWENNNVLDIHMKTKHFTTIVPKLGEMLESEMEIKIHEIII